MEIDLVFKIAAIGIIVAVLNQLLIRSGREDQAMMTTLAGLVVVLAIVCQQISELFVTIKGSPNQDCQSPKYGMVMDFGDLKRIVQRRIIEVYDHALVLNKDNSFVSAAKSMNTKLVLTDFQPTCENMLIHFAQIISSELPEEVELQELKLHETATSFATWCKEDNK